MARPSNGNFNDTTGDSLVTKAATDAYLSGWEAIWGSKKKAPVVTVPVVAENVVDDVEVEGEASSQ